STVSEVEKLAAEAEKRIETARQAMTRQDATAPVITRSESKTEVDIDAMIERASELKRDNGAYRQPLADVQDLLAKNKIPEAAGLARELLRDDADMIFGDVEEFLKSVQALRSETRPASTETLSVPISNFPEFVRQWRDTYAPGIQAVNGYTFEPHVADTMVALTRKELQGESFLAITRETSGLRFLNFNRVRGNRALNQPNYIRDVNITIVGRYIYISAQSWLEYGQNRVDTREKRGIRFPIEKDRVSLRFDPSTGSLQLVLPADAQAKLDRYVTEFSAEEALHHSEPWKQVALNHVQLISSAETAELVEQRSETRQKVTPQPIPVQVGQGLVIASESGKFVHRISVNSTHPDRGEVEVWRVGAVSGTTIRKGESEEVSAGIFVTPSAIHSREVDFDVEGPEGTVVFTSKQYEWIEMMSSSDRQAELQNVIHALEDVLARAQRTKQDTVVPAAKDHLEKLRSKWVSISDVDRARNYFTEQWWNGIPDVDRQGERPMARLPFSSLLNSGDDVVFRCGSVDRFELLRDGSIRYSERDKADWQAFKAPRVLNLDLRADERLLNSDSAGPMKEIAELIRTNPDAEVLILKEGGQHFKYEGSGLALVLPSGRAFWAFQDLGSKVTALDSKPELTGSIRSFPSDRHMRSVIEQYMTDHGVLGQRSEARNNLTTEQGKTVMVKTPNAVYEIYVREVAGEMVSIEKPIDGSKVGRRVERYGIGDAVELEGSIRIIVEAIRGNEREVDLRVADGVDAELYSQKAYARLQVEAAETRSEVRNIITPVRIETPIAMLRDRTQAEILLKALIPETGTPLRILESWNDLQGSGNILPAQAQRIGNAIWVRMSPNDRLIPLVLEDSDTLLIGGVEGNEPILVHQVPLRDRQWMFRVSAAELLGMEYAVHVERSPIELVGADAIEDSMPAGRVRAQSWEEYLMQPDHLIYSEKVVKQVLNAAGVAEAPSPFILQDMFWPRILRVQSKTGDRSPSLALLIFLPGKETEGQTDDYPGRLIVIPLQQREKLYREQYEDFLQLQEAILREYDTDGQATPVGSIVPEVVRLPAQYASVFDAENAVLRIFRSESRAESLTELLEKFKTLRIESLNTRDEKILREQALNVPVLRFRIKEQLDQEVWAQIQYQLNLLLTVQRQPLARLARFMMEEVASLRDIGPLMTDQEANSERIAELTRSVETNRGEIQTAIEAMNPQIGDEKEAIGQLLEQAGLMPEQHAALLWAVLDDMKGIQDTERMAAVAVLTDQYQRSETRRDSFGMPGSGGTGAIDTRYILDLLTRLRTKPAEAMQELTAIATALEALETRLAEIKDDKNYADTDAFKREISDPFKALAQRWRELALVMTSFSMLPKAFRVLSDLHLQDKLDGAVLEGNQMKVESAQELAQSIRQQYESGELGRMQETLAELESQFERLRVRMLYFNTDVTIVSRYVIDRWTAAGLRRIHEEEAASRRQRYGYLETGYQRPSEERSEMRRKKQAEPISSELEERVQRLMAVPQKVEEFEPHSLLERVFAVDSRKLREMILLERQLKDFRTLLEKNPQTVKAPTPYMAEITGPDNKTALQIVTIALERLSERIAWHYETQLANFIRHRWGHIQQTARGNEGDVMVGNRYYQMMISEERDSVYVELGRNFRESGKSYPIEAEIRNAGFSMAITDPETVKLIKSAVATRISAWNRDVQEDLFKGMMERRMRTQRSETRAEDQLVLSLPADKFMEVVSQQSGVVEPFMKSEKPTMEELLQRETPQFVIFEVMDAGEDVNRDVRSIDLIFTMSALNEHGIQPSEHGGDARQLLLYSRDRVNLAWATPESRVKVWRKLRDHKTQLQLNDEQLQQVAQVLDIAAIVANVEEEIKWLATHQQIEEAIRVFTLNRHTFDPEALGRLTEVLEANYQGPIAIVGKVGGSTWAFEAGTPWGLLGYRISGRTNEKEDGTPLANEQEFTDRLTGALGQMVERYGVNRVMHAYFSAPGSFDVNGVLLEDEPNIPTVKKGYSFMMKIGAALNAKYPRPAVLGSIPVMTDHDATAGAKGEMNKVFGTLQAIPAESMTIFYIIAGTGVGSRIMVRGQPFLGDERVSFLHNEVHPIVFNRNEVNPDFTYTALETRGLHPDFTNEFLADGVTPNPNYQGEDLEDRTSGPRIAKRAQELVQDMIDYPANYTEDEVNDARCLAYAVARTDLIDTRLLGEAANANPRYEEAVRNGYGVAGYAAADQWTQLPMPRLLPGGNRLAQRIIRERAMELGIGLVVDIVESKKIWPELLLPDHVVVGSGVAQIGQLFLDGVREGVRRRTAQYKATGEVDFIGADFDENAFARRFILSEIADDTAREFFGGLPTVESANHFQRKIEQTQQRSETRQEESEREIVELATTDRIQEAIRVFTLNRHTFDPEAIGRLTEVLEANYQGPVAIVGKVGGSTWAFEAGTPWGLLGYRIAGRTNEKEDGTPVANEQEFTDRLTGALGQMVERYGVNRVMHAYFSAPGSFDVNGVLLEDEPNIPTVKKGYSFMIKIGASLNAKYPRPAALGTIPVMTDHDATAGAKGEMNKVFGTLQAINAEDMTIFYVIAGTGVGTRFMVRHQPFLGDERVSFLHNEVHPLVFNRNEVNPDFAYTALETHGLHPDFTNEFLADGVTPNPNYQGEDLEDRTSGPKIAAYAAKVIRKILENPDEYGPTQVLDAKILYYLADGDLSKLDTKILGHAANGTPAYMRAALEIIEEYSLWNMQIITTMNRNGIAERAIR
ncbi:MAG: hypothetical protein PHN49_08340, partial [Candidatus Omnitrophica bacterium]|nr:hypothetical protein [Candidatus Omnitrophota bacterium]